MLFRNFSFSFSRVRKVIGFWAELAPQTIQVISKDRVLKNIYVKERSGISKFTNGAGVYKHLSI